MAAGVLNLLNGAEQKAERPIRGLDRSDLMFTVNSEQMDSANYAV
jgi:hypothetical protein